MSIRSICLSLCMMLVPVVQILWAQESRSFGVYGDYSLNRHSADFQQLPGVPNCCPRFEQGSGSGISFGLLYQLGIPDPFVLQLRGGYSSLNGVLTTTEPTTILHEGASTSGEFTHRVDATIGTVGIEPLFGVRVAGDLRLNIGFDAGMLVAKRYDQREEITKPDGAGTFLDSLGHDTHIRVRNQFSGDIPRASSLQMALLGGISYRLPLNAGGTVLVSPELLYYLGLTPIASGLKWNVNSLRLGVAITLSPYKPEESQPGALAAGEPRIDSIPAAREHSVHPPVATMTAEGMDAAGNELPGTRLTVEEFSARLTTPLLNYVFFDENSADIPGRYRLLRGQDIDTFNIDRINSPEKLPTYHHLLNIVGRRLQDNPKARITLTGCNQDIRQEQGNLQLSRKRAEAVRDYLKGVWHISDERIRIEARNLSTKAANTQTQDGAEENRRVEITSDDPMILSPIITDDTVRIANPPSVRFRPVAPAGTGVASWQLTAVQDGRTLKRFEGRSGLPAVLDWTIADKGGTIPRYTGDVRYTLLMTDSAGEQTTVEKTIPVEQMTIRRKRTERRGDKEIDRSSLILFDVRSAELSPAAVSLIPMIRGAIQPTSTVTVTGYTDRLGDAVYNQQLAQSRAAAVAGALGARSVSSKGIGQADLYDSSLPEGRLYTRTVDVLIETPVNQ